MDLKRYLSVLWRRKWIIAVTTVVTLLVTVIVHSMSTPVYVATATLRIAIAMGGTQNTLYYTYNAQLMNTYVEIAASRPVQTELANRLNMAQAPRVKAEVLPNTELIRITTENPNPKLAALTSNTLAQILMEQSNHLYVGGAVPSTEILAGQVKDAGIDLEKTRKDYERLIVQTPAAPDQIEGTNQILQEKQRTYETLLRQYEQAQYRQAVEASMITIVEEATVPKSPSGSGAMLNYALGAIVGLMAGVLLAFAFENMDDRLYTSEEIEAMVNIPTLAKLPRAQKQQLDYASNKFSPLIEAMRYLLARIQLDSKTPNQTLMITGTEPAQGTSTISVNLASLLAEQGKRVALVDCNLRHPKLHNLFGLSNDPGLTDILSEKTDWKKAIQKSTTENISVITAGSEAGAPLQAFDPARTEKLIESLRQQFEYIIMDTPALSVADAAMLASQTDGVILVARRSHTRRGSIQSASNFLSRFTDKFIGLVVNEA